MAKLKHAPILSARADNVEARALNSVWSPDTYLSLRTLIYIASLLEKQLAKPPRKRSKWQEFVAREMKSGRTLQECAEKWKQIKAIQQAA
jgi:hypothetical protein